jgi:flavin-dependent dehydrogenase
MAARRRGFEVTVADSAIPPIDKACGEGVMPDGLAAARALGLHLDTAPGYPFRGIRFLDRDASVEAAFPGGPGRGLRRTVLHRAMCARAEEMGVRLAWGTPVHGISSEGAFADGGLVRARWIVGADGSHSVVRRWAGLEACHRERRRFGFRRHFAVAPWSPFMEIHWADPCQLYITPVGCEEICAVVISRDPHLRLSDALPLFPAVEPRLRNARALTPERGAVTVSRRLKRVWGGNVALIGDASGSVDAITGEGLCLLLQQAEELAGALADGDLTRYQAAHRRIGRRPAWMAQLMLLLDRHPELRRRAIGAMAAYPRSFARLLDLHTGAAPSAGLVSSGLALGWRMLTS